MACERGARCGVRRGAGAGWHPEGVEILWWLVPSVVVTICAMLWISWLGRQNRGEVDRDVAVQQMAKALRTEHRGLAQPSPRVARRPDRSTGVALRAHRTADSARPASPDRGEGRRTA